MNEQAFIQNLQELSLSKKKKVKAVVRYLQWCNKGGRKTAEVKRGEELFKEFEQLKMTVATV